MGFLAELVDGFQDELERRRNRPFLSATMAACSLVATADGEVSFGERVRVDQILETLERLRAFDPHEGIDLFNDFADAILANPKLGHERAWRAMNEGAPDVECRDLLIRICLAVSEANVETSLADQIEIISICSRLGVDPGVYGLQVEADGSVRRT